jgi:hypothetical protein
MEQGEPKPTIDFSGYIADRTRDFTGREWVFAEVDRWLADPSGSSFFIITGEPGVGKSAIAARLTQVRKLAAYHFCIARQSDTIDPLVFVRSLASQLAKIPQFALSVLEEAGVEITQNVRENYGQMIGAQIGTLILNAPSVAKALPTAITQPLKALYAAGYKQQTVILVDALDEAAQTQDETIIDLLANIGPLPQQVRFVLTSRLEGPVLAQFEQQQIPHFRLDAGRAENLEDIRRYVRDQVGASQTLQERLAAEKMSLDAFVERVAAASKGNFLYVVWMLPAIASGEQKFGDPGALPRGLDGIYRDFLRTRKVGRDEDRWRSLYRPVVGVLAAAQAALTAQQVRSFMGLGKQVVVDVLRDIGQFLAPNLAADGLYRLYHQSLTDFLDNEERAGEFWIDLGEIHQRIAANCLERYGPAWLRYDDYAIEHILDHLREAIKRMTDSEQDEARRQLQGQQAALSQNQMFQTGRELAMRTIGTVDRPAALGAINAWLADPAGDRTFLITGAPGSGKTVLAQQLAHMSRGGRSATSYPAIGTKLWVAYHHCRVNEVASLDPGRFADSISRQLAYRFPEFAAALNAGDDMAHINVSLDVGSNISGRVVGVFIENLMPEPAEVVFERSVREPLRRMLDHEFGDTILILVDGLDEVLALDQDRQFLRLLAHVDDLPRQVRFLLTTRPDESVLWCLAVPAFDLNGQDGADERETHDYIYQRLAQAPEPQRTEYSNEIARRAGGSFLYARLLIDSLAADAARDMPVQWSLVKDPENLTMSVRDLLLWGLARNLKKWEALYQPVLGLLAVASGNGLTARQLSQILRLSMVDVHDALADCSGVLQSPSAKGPFRLFHTSFRDFLLEDPDFNVYPVEAHQKIADFYSGSAAAGWKTCDEYGLRHTPAHLIAACRGTTWAKERKALVDRLYSLFADAVYADAAIEVLGKANLFVQIQSVFDFLEEESNKQPDLLDRLAPLRALWDTKLQAAE